MIGPAALWIVTRRSRGAGGYARPQGARKAKRYNVSCPKCGQVFYSRADKALAKEEKQKLSCPSCDG